MGLGLSIGPHGGVPPQSNEAVQGCTPSIATEGVETGDTTYKVDTIVYAAGKVGAARGLASSLWIYWDADLATPLEEITHFIAPWLRM